MIQRASSPAASSGNNISTDVTVISHRVGRRLVSSPDLRSFAFQLAMATSLDETYPRRGTLQIVRWGVRTSYGIVRTDDSMALQSLTYGGAVE